MRMKRLIVIAVVVMLAGCATQRLSLPTENVVTAEKVAQIKKGATTKVEVQAIFGVPYDRIVFPDSETWFYKDFNLKPLHIEFDVNGVVKGYLTDD